jgi:hypothetical protein
MSVLGAVHPSVMADTGWLWHLDASLPLPFLVTFTSVAGPSLSHGHLVVLHEEVSLSPLCSGME